MIAGLTELWLYRFWGTVAWVDRIIENSGEANDGGPPLTCCHDSRRWMKVRPLVLNDRIVVAIFVDRIVVVVRLEVLCRLDHSGIAATIVRGCRRPGFRSN